VNSFSNVKIFIPYQIAEHTYRALGYKKPRKKAREDGRRLQRYCQNVIDMIFPANIEILDWETDIEAHPAYLKGYKEIHLLYQTNENFWYDVRETTREVLNGKLKPDADIEDAIDEGINYLLKEISFFIMSHKIFQIKRMGFVYHNGWHILEKLVNGDYDEKQRENFGMIIVKFY
jgi:tRNA-dependent cyclodipeptide synthase